MNRYKINKEDDDSKRQEIIDSYLEKFPPYESHPSIGIDLVAMTRYARSVGKKPIELTEEELSQFKTK